MGRGVKGMEVNFLLFWVAMGVKSYSGPMENEKRFDKMR